MRVCFVAGQMQMSGCRLLRHWVKPGRKQVRLEMAAPQPAPVAAQQAQAEREREVRGGSGWSDRQAGG